jgi:hypothetical protein
MADYIRVLSLENRDLWEKEHQDGGLPSQSWDYAWANAASGTDPRLAVVQAGGARMLLPFFERQWMETTDIATVLGLSGASISSNSTAPLLHWRHFATKKGWVAGYIQLSAGTTLSESPSPGELVKGNAVFVFDLRTWSLKQSSTTIRRKVKYATKSGVALVDDRAVLADSLKELYPIAMQRVGARPQYNLSSATLDRLTYTPSSLALGVDVGGAVEMVALFLIAGDRADGQFVGTSERGREYAAWLYAKGIELLRDQGVRLVNLGGGVIPGDGIYQFKEKFGARPTRLYAVRQIYDRVKYEELCKRAGAPANERWFPAYRAPHFSASQDNAHDRLENAR